MTCKNCGELVRITVRGDSYCWKHYDESLRATDVSGAVLNQQEYLTRIRELFRQAAKGPRIINIS